MRDKSIIQSQYIKTLNNILNEITENKKEEPELLRSGSSKEPNNMEPHEKDPILTGSLNYSNRLGENRRKLPNPLEETKNNYESSKIEKEKPGFSDPGNSRESKNKRYTGSRILYNLYEKIFLFHNLRDHSE